MAVKYFGSENPIGKIIQFNKELAFKVTGIINAAYGNNPALPENPSLFLKHNEQSFGILPKRENSHFD
jgi:hypothetical protein